MREMKDSGIPWIGEMPGDWRTEKFKHLFRIKKVLAGKLGYDVLSVTQKGLKVKDIESNEGQIAKDYSNYQIVNPGDFVMNHMDLLTGYVDVSKQEGVTSPDYRTFYSINDDNTVSKYYLHLFQFCYKTKLFYNLGQGVSNLGRWRLPAEQQNEFVLPVPSPDEQQRIADFLDRKCGEIDDMVTLQEEFIESLKAYKESVITETVTRGLNPNVKLKPSGIDWIGEMPEAWDVIRFKYIHTESNVGESIDKSFFTDDTNDFVYYTAGIQPTHINYKLFPQWKYTRKCDLLLARNGTPYVYYPIENACYSDHIIRVDILDGYEKRYVRYCLQRAISTIVVDGVSIPTWSISLWNELFIPNPSLSEQNEIANYLDKICSEIDSLISIKQQKIADLKEYKKSIIYEYVTGKKEVDG